MAYSKFELSTLAKLIQFIWKQDGDIVICVSGSEGVGKSTFAYWLAKLTQPTFDLRKQVAYIAKEGLPLMLHAQAQCVLWFDENLFYKRDHAKREHKFANEVMQRCRFLNRCYINCTPRLGDMDEYFRNHRVKLWFKVTEKGNADIYEPVDTEIGDPWNLDDPRRMKLKNRRGFVHFDKMSEEDDIEYRQIKEEGFDSLKLRYEEEILGNKDNGRNETGNNRMNVDNVVKVANHFDISQKVVCDILGYNYASFRVTKSKKAY